MRHMHTRVDSESGQLHCAVVSTTLALNSAQQKLGFSQRTMTHSSSATLSWPAELLAKVTALQPRQTVFGFGLHHAPFVALYAVALKLCVDTSGQPYELAIAQRAALAAEAADVLEDTSALLGNATALNSATNGTASATAADVPLPHENLPAFWALLFLAVVFLAHSLLWFAQRWSVRFRAWVQFRRAPRNVVVPLGWLLVEPHPHQGTTEIVRVRRASLSLTELWFEFQRQRFDVDQRLQRIEPLRCPVDRPLSFYLGAEGLNIADVPRIAERFGRNSVEEIGRASCRERV